MRSGSHLHRPRERTAAAWRGWIIVGGRIVPGFREPGAAHHGALVELAGAVTEGVGRGGGRHHEGAQGGQSERRHQLAGARFCSMARAWKIGTNKVVTAVLLASSVRNMTNVTTAAARRNNGPPPVIAVSMPARNSLAPVELRTLLRGKPPPNKSNTPQSVPALR